MTDRNGRWRKIGVITAAVLAGLAGIGTVFGFLGGRQWILSLMSNLRVQYAVIFVVVIAIAAVIKSRPLITVGLAGLLINALMIVPLYFGGPATAESDSPELRIMFLNAELRRARPGWALDDLAANEPDLIVFAAATDRWADAMESIGHPYRVVLRRAAGTDVEWVVVARDDVTVDADLIEVAGAGRPAVEMMVEVDGMEVAVLAVHALSPIGFERAQIHDEDLARAAEWARDQTGAYAVVGDLNATPWSPAFGELLEGGALLNSQRGYGVQASWPISLGPFGIPIDHLLHSDRLTTTSRELGEPYGSDHRSLHVTLALAERDRG